jgi:osmotically inducible protein OsmC
VPRIRRTADVVWEGNLARGTGTISAGTGAFSQLPYSVPVRVGPPADKTSPEELLAAAEASCFSMALSNILDGEGHPPERLDVSAACTIDTSGGGAKVTTMEIEVRGRVDGIDGPAFEKAASEAADGCPISGALKGNVDISVSATLEG